MKRYLVDFVFLPDRDGGAQLDVTATDTDAAVVEASRQLTSEIGAAWAFELVGVPIKVA